MVLKFDYLKDMDDVYSFNTSGVDRGKEIKQGKVGVDVTALITYNRKYGNILPSSRRRGGMQNHLFMAVPEKKKFQL